MTIHRSIINALKKTLPKNRPSTLLSRGMTDAFAAGVVWAARQSPPKMLDTFAASFVTAGRTVAVFKLYLESQPVPPKQLDRLLDSYGKYWTVERVEVLVDGSIFRLTCTQEV